jgi:hypothetical protein
MELLVKAWNAPSKITDQIKQNYRKPLQASNWDRALWELTIVKQGKVKMKLRVEDGIQAPDFELTDTRGEKIRLSDYRGKPVVLVMLRGFM